MRRRIISSVAVAVLIGAGFLGGPLAWAGPIDPGFDLFATPAGFSSVDLDGPGPMAPVSLVGEPIGPGDTDTIVERKGGLPAGGISPPTIPIELVALSLRSVSPVDIGGTNFDLVVLGGDMLIPRSSADGAMTIITHDDVVGGGTFTSSLPIDVDLIFTAVGDPANTFTEQFTDTLIGSGVWSHTPRRDDAHTLGLPAGGFFAGVDPQTGGKRLTEEESLLAAHGVLPAQIPEPSTLLLLGSGLVGLGAAAWRRRNQ